MTLANAAESNLHTTKIGAHEIRFGKLTMRDFATLQSKAGSMTYNTMLDWCQTPAGCLATVAMAMAKADPVATEEYVDALGTPMQIAEVAIDILNISNGANDQTSAEGKEAGGKNPTG